MNTPRIATAATGLCLLAVLAAAEGRAGGVEFRVRITALTPDVPCRIKWRYGGEGLGGDPVTGEITAERPTAPSAPSTTPLGEEPNIVQELEEKPADRIVVEEATYNYTYLRRGAWSDYRPLSTFRTSSRRLFATFTLEAYKSGAPLRNGELEFEFRHGGRTIKTFRVQGPDGPTFGVVIPVGLVDAAKAPLPEFEARLGSLKDYVHGKAAALREVPWMSRPTPKRYGLLTDCGGYGTGSGYKIRTTDRTTMLAELEILSMIGLNGLRGSPSFFMEMVKNREGIAAGFARVREGGAGGYPIPLVDVADGRMPTRRPGDGCPFHPDNLTGIDERCAQRADEFLAGLARAGIEEGWGLTVDEIGSVFGRAPEGRDHPGCCPYCREAFRAFVRAEGRTLEDFGAPAWDDVRPVQGYWSKTYWESLSELEGNVQSTRTNMETAARAGADEHGPDLRPAATPEAVDDLIDTVAGGEDEEDAADAFVEANAELERLKWSGRPLRADAEERRHRLSPEGWRLLEFYSARFFGLASAGLFEPLQKAFAARNAAKQAALDRGETDTPAARQPWIYSFALRGNTFLMGGDSLGFFDFYRHADNAMVYETSNRDPRVWQWDTYLCDVGRSLTRFMGKKFGIYVKPHRGAPVQRALAAVTRGVRMIFWYTYGPEWSKGDTFGGDIEDLKSIAWASRLIAGVEDVAYDGDWALPAEVAIVRPRTTEFFSGAAAWENGKWVYTALMHAHIPMDALDEALLMTEDLSRYKAIVVSGSHIRRDAAARLAAWVEAGGTLYTCGWGMAEDEARRPLEILWPVFGLKSRGRMETWGTIGTYGATRLQSIQKSGETPADAAVTGAAPLSGTFTPMLGREVLDPADPADIAATYADGRAAAVRHRYGKGTAWLVGVHAGLEYAWETMQRKPFDAGKRSFVAAPVLAAGVRPVVDADEPLVEGVLMRNPKTGRQAVVLINWQFHLDREVKVTVRGAGPVAAARSVALDAPVRIAGTGADTVEFILPRLDEGDVLLLE